MKATLQTAGHEEALASLQMLEGDLPARALADALNHTANQARIALRTEMSDVFDRPTPFTLNAIRVLNATPASLEAAVWVKDDKDNNSKAQAPEDWVAPQVYGGGRELKKSEQMLRARGILPPGRFVVPGAGAKLDQWGNMARGQTIQMLSGLQLFTTAGFTANSSSNWRSFRKGHAKAFFVMRRGRVPIGIAERRGRTLAIVLAFVRAPQYQRRLHFHDVVERVAEANLTANINRAIAQALQGKLPTNFRRRPQAWPKR
ncbi:hypothetical protein [Metapseudomonas otitidis]|uniref:hypothetical protein n=1 Tax=Metapseudomonas otitidis TaxID=319939 RepID=UPI001F43BA7D|nr:hypothetical protein [Pseudomonas otitidis]